MGKEENVGRNQDSMIKDSSGKGILKTTLVLWFTCVVQNMLSWGKYSDTAIVVWGISFEERYIRVVFTSFLS